MTSNFDGPFGLTEISIHDIPRRPGQTAEFTMYPTSRGRRLVRVTLAPRFVLVLDAYLDSDGDVEAAKQFLIDLVRLRHE